MYLERTEWSQHICLACVDSLVVKGVAVESLRKNAVTLIAHCCSIDLYRDPTWQVYWPTSSGEKSPMVRVYLTLPLVCSETCIMYFFVLTMLEFT